MGVTNGSEMTLVNINDFKNNMMSEEGEFEQEEMEAEQEDLNEQPNAEDQEGQEKNEEDKDELAKPAGGEENIIA